MLGRRVVIGNPIAGVELPEYLCIELPAVVADQNSGYAKSAEDVFLHKTLHLLLGYGLQRPT